MEELKTSDPWKAASAMSDGCEVEVVYEQKNGNGMSTKRGEVMRVHAASETTCNELGLDEALRIRFERDNGTTMEVTGSQELRSPRSMHPFVGDVIQLRVIGASTNNELPEPTNDPVELAVIRAQKTAVSDTAEEALAVGINHLEDEDVLEDWNGEQFSEWLEELGARVPGL